MNDEYATRVLTITTLIIISVFWLILIYLSAESPVSQTKGGGFFKPCPPGQCATNFYNGQKRCPEDLTNGVVVSDLTIEVCNPPNKCTSGRTPYALQTDGSTDSLGICEADIVCQCLPNASCARYITTVIETTNGNPYTTTSGQTTTFVQNLVGNSDVDINSLTTFCQIPNQWLLNSSPGCTEYTSITPETLTKCVSSTDSNPCLLGTLAIIGDSTLTPQQLLNLPVACVRGEQCESGKVAIWDVEYNNIVCKKIF